MNITQELNNMDIKPCATKQQLINEGQLEPLKIISNTKPNETINDLLKACLYALNSIPNTIVNAPGYTSTYQICSRLEEVIRYGK